MTPKLTSVQVTQDEANYLRIIKIQISQKHGRMITMAATVQMLISHWESDASETKIQNALQNYLAHPELPELPRIPELTQNQDAPKPPQNWLPLGGEKGGVALIDEADWELVARHSWHPVERTRMDGRTVTYAQNGRGLFLHTLITGYALVDHISGDGLDCRRVNLREATQEENMANQRKGGMYAGKPTSSRFKGVTWDKRANKWLAQIVVKGQGRSLGRYLDETDAARAYDRAAREAWGSYARCNFEDS
jgi:hypothetical protein